MSLPMRRTAYLLSLSALSLMASPVQAAEDAGTESAILITSVLTILAVALVFFVLVLPDEDRRRIAAAMVRAKHRPAPSPD